MSINKVILLGRLGQNPELKTFQSGAKLCSFSLATSEARSKENNKTSRADWHKVAAWGDLGEFCKKHLKKGDRIYVEGCLKTREWEDADGKKKEVTEIVAAIVDFASSGTSLKKNDSQSEESQGYSPSYPDESIKF